MVWIKKYEKITKGNNSKVMIDRVIIPALPLNESYPCLKFQANTSNSSSYAPYKKDGQKGEGGKNEIENGFSLSVYIGPVQPNCQFLISCDKISVCKKRSLFVKNP